MVSNDFEDNFMNRAKLLLKKYYDLKCIKKDDYFFQQQEQNEFEEGRKEEEKEREKREK